MDRKKYIIVFSSILLVFLVFLNIARITGTERSSLNPIENGVKTIATPFQKGISSVFQRTKDVFGSFQEIKTLRKENVLLKEKVSELSSQIDVLRDYRLENQRLKVLLNYETDHKDDFQFEVAKVIARNPNNWYSTLTIDLGSNDGLLKDMPVVTHQGLVGKIINVSKKSSDVLLILDQDGAVPARVWETRDTPGVVEGKGDSESILSLIYLPHDTEIKKDHTVVTSGLGGVFPQGIRIGKVTDVIDESNGLMKKAFIKPFVDFGKIEEVLVIVNVSKSYDEQFEKLEDEEDKENEA